MEESAVHRDCQEMGIKMPILEQLHRLMNTIGKDTHELDCWAREKGLK